MPKRKKKIERAPQVAALPVRVRKDGSYEVLLVTSRDTGRWIIPKGWPMKGRRDYAAASLEALEEAGVRGTISHTSIGSFDYTKIMPKGEDDIEVCATVYLLEVEKILDDWEERKERERKWFSLSAAASRVDEPQLKRLIKALSEADRRKLAS